MMPVLAVLLSAGAAAAIIHSIGGLPDAHWPEKK